jgi:uncharacterized membrane protein
MNARLAALWPWALAALATALLLHLATVAVLPHAIMARALSAMTRHGAYNTMSFEPKPSAQSRGVVRPSPDLLYSICPYDLSAGPLVVEAHGPSGSYWSVSVFDAATDNVFVRNDAQAPSGAIRFMLLPPRTERPAGTGGIEPVPSPSMRGLVLIRTLIADETALAEIDAARRQSSCETWHPAPVQS